MAHHTAEYGQMNHDYYYIILRELYDTVQRSVMTQHDIQALYEEIGNYFADVFLDNILDNYADMSDTFQGALNAFAEYNDYMARYQHLADLNQQLISYLNMYRSNLTNTASLLEQVQTINSGFTLPDHPYSFRINVTGTNWLVIEAFNTDFDWNPEIFHFETLNSADEAMLRMMSNTIHFGPDYWEVVLAFNAQSDRQTRTITYSPAGSPDVFNTERNNPIDRNILDIIRNRPVVEETRPDIMENSADQEARPDIMENSEDEEARPAKRKRSEDEETEPDKGENSADEEAEPQPQSEDVDMDDLYN